MMKIINSLDGFSMKEKTAVAVGYFDGLHLGHRKVIDSVLEYKKKGYKVCVFSFKIDESLPKSKSTTLITTLDDKIKLLTKMGVDYLVIPDFREIKDILPEDFLENILRKKLSSKIIACGDDYRFGKGAKGNIGLLKDYAIKNDIKLQIIDPVSINGIVVSSSLIKENIEKGDMEKANMLLGRPFSYNLIVNKGKQVGRTLDFPTINQHFEKNQIMPRFGVYAGVVEYQDKLYGGAVNIGIIPTIRVKHPVSETFIIDFKKNVYNKKIRVGLIKFLRDEVKFNSIEELKKQISLDTVGITQIYNQWKKEFEKYSKTIFY